MMTIHLNSAPTIKSDEDYQQLFAKDKRYAPGALSNLPISSDLSSSFEMTDEEFFNIVLQSFSKISFNFDQRALSVDFNGTNRDIELDSDDCARPYFSKADASKVMEATRRYLAGTEPCTDDSQFEERVTETILIINKFGLILSAEHFKKYCRAIRGQGFEPLSYPFVLWLQCLKAIGFNGILCKAMPKFSPSAANLQLCFEVCQALFNGHILMAKANDNSDQVLYYLLPAVLAGKSLSIVSDNSALLDVIYHGYHPLLSTKLGLDQIKVATLDDTHNYLCRYRLHCMSTETYEEYKEKSQNPDYVPAPGYKIPAKTRNYALDLSKTNQKELQDYSLTCNYTTLDDDLNQTTRKKLSCTTQECEAIGKVCPFRIKYKKLLEQKASGDEPQVDYAHCTVIAAYEQAKSSHITLMRPELFLKLATRSLKAANSSSTEQSDFISYQLPDAVIIDDSAALSTQAQSYFVKTIDSKELLDCIKKIDLFALIFVYVERFNKLVPELDKALFKMFVCYNLLKRGFRLLATLKDAHKLSYSLNSFKYQHHLDLHNKPIASPFTLLEGKLLSKAELDALGSNSHIFEVLSNSGSADNLDESLDYPQDPSEIKKWRVPHTKINAEELKEAASTRTAREEYLNSKLYQQFLKEAKKQQGKANRSTEKEESLVEAELFRAIISDLHDAMRDAKQILQDNLDSFPELTSGELLSANGYPYKNDPSTSPDQSKAVRIPLKMKVATYIEKIDYYLDAFDTILSRDYEAAFVNDADDQSTISIKQTSTYLTFEIALQPKFPAQRLGRLLRAMSARGTSIILSESQNSGEKTTARIVDSIGLSSDEVIIKG